jgi:hypothetical protein
MCLFFAANNERILLTLSNSLCGVTIQLNCFTQPSIISCRNTFIHSNTSYHASTHARTHTHSNPISFAQMQHAITHHCHFCTNVKHSLTPYSVRQKKAHISITPNIVILCHLASILAQPRASVCVCACVCVCVKSGI